MKSKFRLTSSIDIKRVRRYGTSYAHPLVVLICSPNDQQQARFAVTASRSTGNAVDRNRAKRLLRAALNNLIPHIPAGWDFVVIARRPLVDASCQETEKALKSLLEKADLIDTANVN